MKKPTKMLFRKLCFLSLGLIFSSLLTAAGGITQDLNKTIIPVQLKNASLKQAFHQIESETKLLFTFKTKDVSAYNNISYNSPGVAVARLLNDLLQGTGLQYEQMENNIIIKKTPAREAVPEIPDFTGNAILFEGGIHGRVTNESGEPVGSASIYIKNLKAGTSANEKGEFNLSGLKAGTYAIQVSAVGYVINPKRCHHR